MAGGLPGAGTARRGRTRRWRPPSAAAAALLASLTLVAACSSSPSTTATTSGSQRAADTKLAERSVLTLSDFPSGWTKSGSVSVSAGGNASGLTRAEARQTAACLHVPVAQIAATPPSANSPTFSDSSGSTSVVENVELFATDAAAGADLALFAQPDSPSCLIDSLGPDLTKSVRSGLPAGSTVGHLTGRHLSIPAIAGGSSLVELELPTVTSGVPVVLHVELVVAIRGRAEADLFATGPSLLGSELVNLARRAAALLPP